MNSRVITDSAFAGEEGMLKVWNPHTGPVQVTDEGHLLDGTATAWVDDNDTLRELVESGNAVLLDGTPQNVTKKNSKPKVSSPVKESSSETSPMSEEPSDHLLAAPTEGATDGSVFKLDDSPLL